MYNILFLGHPQNRTEKIFEHCNQLGSPKSLYSTPTCTVKSWDIQTVSLVNIPVTEETFMAQKPLIQSFYSTTEAIVFVIDLKQSSQIEEIRKIINELLNDENDEIKMPKVPVLILVNKDDKDNQCTTEDIKKKLNIAELENRELKTMWKAKTDTDTVSSNISNSEELKTEDTNAEQTEESSQNIRFHIQLCNIRDNEGLYEGMDWISENMKNGKEAIEVVHSSGCMVQ